MEFLKSCHAKVSEHVFYGPAILLLLASYVGQTPGVAVFDTLTWYLPSVVCCSLAYPACAAAGSGVTLCRALTTRTCTGETGQDEGRGRGGGGGGGRWIVEEGWLGNGMHEENIQSSKLDIANSGINSWNNVRKFAVMEETGCRPCFWAA